MNGNIVAGLLFSLVLPCLAQEDTNESRKHCNEHPPRVPSDPSVKAREKDQGIRYIVAKDYANTIDERGRRIAPDLGGAPCSYASVTPRGRATRAVGSLLYNGDPHCSAVLVGPATAITAGHCVYDWDTGKFQLIFGNIVKHRGRHQRVYKVDKAEARLAGRPYDPQHHGVNDIAYLYLHEIVPNVRPAELPSAQDEVWPPHESFVYAGFGVGDGLLMQRRCVDISVAENCEDSFTNSTPNLGTCDGDSGGGIFRYFPEQKEEILVGLTTWGDENCREFGVNTKIQPHLSWIKERIGNEPPVVSRWTPAFHVLAFATKQQSGSLIDDYNVSNAEVTDERDGVGSVSSGVNADLWHRSGVGIAISVRRYSLSMIEGRSAHGNSPYWGAFSPFFPHPFSVKRRVVTYGIGAGYRWRAGTVLEPFSGAEMVISRVVDIRSGRYTKSQGFSRCALYQATEEQERQADFMCHTGMGIGLRTGLDIVPRRTGNFSMRIVARADEVQGRFVYSIGVGAGVFGHW